MVRRGRERLLEIHDSLAEEQRGHLLEYAEFLVARHGVVKERAVSVPQHIPRPEQESVVGAIKRLSTVYPMLDHSRMLHETAGLMTQHVMQGRAAMEVIDDLEELFKRHYQTQFGACEEAES